METPYSEQDCTIEFEAKKYTSGGSLVTDSCIIGYMSSDMKQLTTWHGDVISSVVKITARWHTPRSYISDHMYQIKVLFNEHWYTGRTTGGSMIARLKRCKD
jgi:hypothetical protein